MGTLGWRREGRRDGNKGEDVDGALGGEVLLSGKDFCWSFCEMGK